MPARGRIDIPDLGKLIAKCAGNALYEEAAKRALDRIGQAGVRAARARAPVGPTKQLSAQLTYKVNAAKAPKWVVIKTTARATPRNPGTRKGTTKYPFAYPARLEYGLKSKHKDWLRNAIKAARPAITREIDSATREIESKWRT